MFDKTFRNTLIASSLLVSASLLAGPAAMAENTGPSSGVIAEVSEFAFTGEEDTPITTGQAMGTFPMGELYVRDNRPAGWGLTVSSANTGKLVHETDANASITYTALTTGNIGDSVPTAVTFTDLNPVRMHNSDYDSVVADELGVTVNVTANIGTPSRSLPAGTYSDTLTFTLVSKE